MISSFIMALPEIIKLIKHIQKQIAEEHTDRKVSEDIKKINEAFEKRDAKLLNVIFNDVAK